LRWWYRWRRWEKGWWREEMNEEMLGWLVEERVEMCG
jgi:hypothetical protein